MQIVRYAPTNELEPGLVLEFNCRYIVHKIIYTKGFGVTFQLVGFTRNKSTKYYSFPANHFRALNGKRADRVMALPSTSAATAFGSSALLLTGLINSTDGDKVWCMVPNNPAHQGSPFPYSEFEHV